MFSLTTSGIMRPIWKLEFDPACFLFVFMQEGIQAEKQTIALLSKMRNELQTDKPVLALTDTLQDTEYWNQYLQKQQKLQGNEESVSWFKSPWLYVECYMYRRVQEALWLKWEVFSSFNRNYCCPAICSDICDMSLYLFRCKGKIIGQVFFNS